MSLNDDRLPNKEQVWGLNTGSEQAAFTAAFLKANPLYGFQLGGTEYLISYSEEFDAVNLFERTIDGKIVDVAEVDIHGDTPQGKLPKAPLHNGVFWMIWSDWFPETQVFN